MKKLNNLRSDLDKIRKMRRQILPRLNKPGIQIFTNLMEDYQQEEEDAPSIKKVTLQDQRTKLSTPQNYEKYNPQLKIK